MSDKVYVYGQNNGAGYREAQPGGPDAMRTHWDPRIEVRAIAETVQVGIIPPSTEHSTDERGVWNSDDGLFLSLSREGVNRLIRSLRELRDEAYGRDE
jgi:hypothetical protein